jgi:hypothetical protein
MVGDFKEYVLVLPHDQVVSGVASKHSLTTQGSHNISGKHSVIISTFLVI